MIRTVQKQDAKYIRDIYNYYIENTVISFEYEPVSIKEMEKRIAEITSFFPFFVAEVENKVIGYAYAKAFGKTPGYQYSVEISIYVQPELQTKGVGSTLFECLETSLKEQGIKVMIASIEASNQTSLNFHQKMGFCVGGTFHHIGYKFDKFLDVTWLQKIVA